MWQWVAVEGENKKKKKDKENARRGGWLVSHMLATGVRPICYCRSPILPVFLGTKELMFVMQFCKKGLFDINVFYCDWIIEKCNVESSLRKVFFYVLYCGPH